MCHSPGTSPLAEQGRLPESASSGSPPAARPQHGGRGRGGRQGRVAGRRRGQVEGRTGERGGKEEEGGESYGRLCVRPFGLSRDERGEELRAETPP